MSIGEVVFLLICLILGSISVGMLVADRDNISKAEGAFLILVLVLSLVCICYTIISYIN